MVPLPLLLLRGKNRRHEKLVWHPGICITQRQRCFLNICAEFAAAKAYLLTLQLNGWRL
jgi:hypothetical protein